MTFGEELEQRRLERAAQDEKNRQEVAALCAGLERLLTDSSQDMNILDRQAGLLDCLLTALMRRNLRKDKENGCISTSQIDMALRIQKQCAETIKAAAAIDYMRSLAPVRARPAEPAPSPPPRQK